MFTEWDDADLEAINIYFMHLWDKVCSGGCQASVLTMERVERILKESTREISKRQGLT
jgi:hypothetical protein